MKLSPKLALLLALCSVQGLTYAQTSYSGTGTNVWNTTRWSNTSSAGPFTETYTQNNDVVFNSGTYGFLGMGSGATINVGNITLNSGATVTFSGNNGIFATNGNVRTLDIASGATLNFGSQAFSTDSGTGFIKNGAGVLSLSGSTYNGGFTLNAGTVVARADTAFGSDAANVLTLNGGTVASNADRSFSSARFGGGIVIGGNVQFGEMSTNVSLAVSTASLTFANDIFLGASNRTFTLGNNGIQTFSGVISNSAGGLSFAANGARTGRIDITGTSNTFMGNIAITGGQVRFTGDGSLGNAENDVIIDGGAFSTAQDLSFSLGSGRVVYLGDGAGSAINTQGISILSINNGLLDKSGESGVLVKQGAGKLSLLGANSYTGNTTISAGELSIEGTSSLSNGNYTGNISISNTDSGRLTFGSTATQRLSGVISGNGDFYINSGKVNLAGSNSLTGNYYVANGAALDLTNSAALNGANSVSFAAGATLDNSSANDISLANGTMSKTFSGLLTYTGSGGRNLHLGAGSNSISGSAMSVTVNGGELTFGGNTTSTGSGFALTKSGAGLLRFDGLQSNVLSGTTTVNAGTLRIVSSANLGSGIIIDVKDNASLSLEGAMSWGGNYILREGSQLIRTDSNVIAANVDFAANRTLTSADSLTNGTQTLKSGVTISTTADYFGTAPTSAVSGRITMEDASAIRSTASFSLAANKGISMAGSANLSASQNQTLTIEGDIVGNSSTSLDIGKTGTTNGTVRLSGSTTGIDTATVNASTLLANGTLGANLVFVNAGASFGGTGTLNGMLFLDEGSSFYVADINDSLTITGEDQIIFGGSFGIANIAGLNWNEVQEGTYTLISTTQNFEGLVNNYGIENTYWFGNGRGAYFETGSLAMVVIPEPSVAILTGLGACALLRRRRSAS